MKQKTTNKKKLRRQAREAKKVAIAGGEKLPVRFSLMAKPIGPVCNLRCTYCFYLEKNALFGLGENYRMPDDVLDAYIRKYIEASPNPEVEFSWQGGEPTLMGVEFYRKVMALQKQYGQGKRITNSLQTNGTLLDEEWGEFLHKHRWLVGLSLDGPAEIHNANRPDAQGAGSFDAVMNGLDVLKRHRVDFNVMSSVTPASTADPLGVYHFLRENGVQYVQFMPIVERLPDDEAQQLGLQLAVGARQGEAERAPAMTPWSVQPAAYGEFLCRIFDRWVRHDVGQVFVMNFEWALSNYMGQPARVCQFMPICGLSLIVEHNGDVYACDHYVYPDHRLGNILTGDLQEMVQSPGQCAFGQAKSQALPKYCANCPVVSACWGECPKRRFMQTPDGEGGLNYLCEGYKAFYTHAAPYFEAMTRLQAAGLPMSDVMHTEIHLMPRSRMDGPTVGR